MKTIKAWYFSGIDKKLRYGDGRTIDAGRTHKFKGQPVLCEAGLHGSVKPLDALNYAPGPVVWCVELSGYMDIGKDKIAATERKYLWGYDATNVLRAFARKCALDVAHLWPAPEIVMRYLKTGDESMRALAWASAMDSTWASARASACASACDSAYVSACDSSAMEKQDKRLYRMIMDGRKKSI